MKSRILVVDDNVNLTTLLGKTLGRFGYDVVAENDSEFALDTTRRVRPNLILLDVMMPNRDGGEVLQDLRKDVLLRNIPVILLTGLAREAQTLANQGGIQSVVLSKPIELKLLLSEIESHIFADRTQMQLMSDKLEAETGTPEPPRNRSAFGGPDPAMLRQTNALPGNQPGNSRNSAIERLMNSKKDRNNGVEMPR